MILIKIFISLALFNAQFAEVLSDAEQEKRLTDKYNECKNFPYRSLSEIARDID